MQAMRISANVCARDWRARLRQDNGVGARSAAFALPLAALFLLSVLAGCASMTPRAHIKPVSRTPLTVAVLGASDAWGVGAQDPDRFNWPSVMAADLERPVHLINLGAPGATLAQANREELPVALDARPDVVVIWLVVNDIIAQTPLTDYSSELGSTLHALRTQDPRARVFVGNAPDLSRLPYFAGADPVQLDAEVAGWNTAIARACAANGATMVNIHATWDALGDHPEYISADGLHPSQAGADALARAFSVAIEVTAEPTEQRQVGKIGEGTRV